MPPIVSAATAMPRIAPDNVLIFDLDNTLYPSACDLFSQVSNLIGQYVRDTLHLPADEAYAIQKSYFHRYGTTLRGLMTEHDIDPADYLNKVHNIDLSVVDPAPELAAALNALPCRKVIFTNASRGHAERVMDRLGIASHFETIFDIVDADYIPKPERQPYDRLLTRDAIDPARAIYFEDMAKNLLPAKDMGMTTVWVHTDEEWAQAGSDDPRIDHQTDNLVHFLRTLAISPV
ncbi:pyrimidine 5'-nucleotidase [Thalassospira xiamenensis]|uniref:HAD family hydrolase n=1 Tax=Thalassospira xiamenensis TaxID=220697 RepID=A0A367X9S8_9PROT|nr:pyrimidine 5'-nucleotidase [Thalassospira xiamenensis]KZB52823.1 HAD family hydrolase [Thalassospira xiamenensis]MCK2168709.1 pyrimidine 5'-nucleotidase [Thalassospira xiamenensis]RCK50416.1 HAD family hydrolase [Thalassospira xiamenensis]